MFICLCFRLDGEDLSVVESYKEQIGAWWLGFPILGILLCVPALFVAWYPRTLPSEVIRIIDGVGCWSGRVTRLSEYVIVYLIVHQWHFNGMKLFWFENDRMIFINLHLHTIDFVYKRVPFEVSK